ncbi:MAG TPA: hypothetical protein VMF31_11090 [Solirubrobacterales bacterium]|nr:hypothetical protein [Solirubrobacterales bacterium]
MATVRNIAIIALLALGVAFLPGGGDFADAVLAAITMGFLAVISFAVFQAYRANRLTMLALPDSRRLVLLSAVGLIVLMIAGSSQMFQTGLGTLAWILLIASGGIAIWLVWSEAKSY